MCAMRPLKLLVLISTLLFISVGAIDDDYYDDAVVDPSNDTDISSNEKYSLIAAQLNCSKLVLRHRGIKVEETRSDSIFKVTLVQRVAPKQLKRAKLEESDSTAEPPSTLPPFPINEFTIPPALFDGQDNLTGGLLIPVANFDYFSLPDFNGLDLNVTSAFDQQKLNPSTGYDQTLLDLPASVDQQLNLTIGDDHQQQLNLTGIYQQGHRGEFPENETPAIADNVIVNEPSKLDTSQKLNGPNTTEGTGIPECAYAFDDDGSTINWYEVIAQNGGIPGEVNATRLTPNITKVLEPCRRPVTNTSPLLEDLLYEYELFEFEKVYRREMAFLRFSGTPSAFVDIVGQLVWAPKNAERRYFRLSYRKDDTGFYVNVRRRHKCVFGKNPLAVNCQLVEDFIPCENNSTVRALSPGLQASLIG